MKRRVALDTNASDSAVLDEILGIFGGDGAEADDIQFGSGACLTIGLEKEHTILVGGENGEREFLGGRHFSSVCVIILVLP